MAKGERKAPAGTITGECMDTCWETPEHLTAAVRMYFGGQVPFDAATTRKNPCRAKRFCVSTGLTKRWPRQVWVNPPYGKALSKEWLPKITKEAALGREIVCLLSCSRWEQRYFQLLIVQAGAVCFIRKRVKFKRPKTGDKPSGNPYANMFLGFNVDVDKFKECFEPLGACLKLEGLCGPPPEKKRGKKCRATKRRSRRQGRSTTKTRTTRKCSGTSRSKAAR